MRISPLIHIHQTINNKREGSTHTGACIFMRSQWSVALIIMYHHNLYHLMFVRHACAPLYIFHGGKRNINTVWHCAFAEWTVRESSSVHVKCMGERETSLKAERASS